MRIPLAGLKKDPKTFRHTGPVSVYLDDPERFSGDIDLQANLKLESGILHLALEAFLGGHFICDRCGTVFDKPVVAREDFFFSLGHGRNRMKDPEMSAIPQGALEIDISQEIRDLVMLSLPIQTLCREECKGLCLICGANLNDEKDHHHEEAADPRWAALKKLKDNE
jgi:uncharacterized protein